MWKSKKFLLLAFAAALLVIGAIYLKSPSNDIADVQDLSLPISQRMLPSVVYYKLITTTLPDQRLVKITENAVGETLEEKVLVSSVHAAIPSLSKDTALIGLRRSLNGSVSFFEEIHPDLNSNPNEPYGITPDTRYGIDAMYSFDEKTRAFKKLEKASEVARHSAMVDEHVSPDGTRFVSIYDANNASSTQSLFLIDLRIDSVALLKTVRGEETFAFYPPKESTRATYSRASETIFYPYVGFNDDDTIRVGIFDMKQWSPEGTPLLRTETISLPR